MFKLAENLHKSHDGHHASELKAFTNTHETESPVTLLRQLKMNTDMDQAPTCAKSFNSINKLRKLWPMISVF
jgi:hypothetical protein